MTCFTGWIRTVTIAAGFVLFAIIEFATRETAAQR